MTHYSMIVPGLIALGIAGVITTIPAPDSVAFAEESGLSGALAEEQPEHVVVESSQGVLGDWTVTLLQAEAPICEGILQVTEGR